MLMKVKPTLTIMACTCHALFINKSKVHIRGSVITEAVLALGTIEYRRLLTRINSAIESHQRNISAGR